MIERFARLMDETDKMTAKEFRHMLLDMLLCMVFCVLIGLILFCGYEVFSIIARDN